MGRPIYPYELGDPDFTWLMSNFQENFPNYSFSENTNLPVVFIKTSEREEYMAVPETAEETPEEDTDHPE